jgi:hypothetical protein
MKVRLLKDCYNRNKTAFIPEGTILESKPGEEFIYYKIENSDHKNSGEKVNMDVYTNEVFRFTLSTAYIRDNAKSKNPAFEIIVDDIKPEDGLIKEYDKTVDQLIDRLAEVTEENTKLRKALNKQDLTLPDWIRNWCFDWGIRPSDYWRTIYC